jgi:5-methylcytosine-specific restriction endonuclease McrA
LNKDEFIDFGPGLEGARGWLTRGNIATSGRFRILGSSKPRDLQVRDRVLFSFEAKIIARAIVSKSVHYDSDWKAYVITFDKSSIEIFDKDDLVTIPQIRELGISPSRLYTPLDQDQYLAMISLISGKNPRLVKKLRQEFAEGEEHQGVTTWRERDPELKESAVAKYGYNCMVCGFDFETKYRDYSRSKNGDRYIELHHTRPVSAMKQGDKTQLDDVIVICSNCHRIIHRTIPMVDWQELRRDLKRWKVVA